MILDVRVPFAPDGNLGAAYNRAMETVDHWAVLLDDDVFLRVQPQWYDIICKAIARYGKDCGLATCVTNRIGCPQQRCVDAPKSDNIIEHMDYAKRRFDKYGYLAVEIPRVKPSGMVMVTSRRVWEKAGKFPNGFLGLDNRYAQQVKNAGFKVYLIEGLYVYHSYKREWKHKK
jgi:GT2 family glycosyltransferase